MFVFLVAFFSFLCSFFTCLFVLLFYLKTNHKCKKNVFQDTVFEIKLLLNCTLIYLSHTYKKLISYIIALVHLILYYLTYFSLFSFHLAVLVRYKTSVMFIIGNLQIVRFGSSVYPQFVLLHGLLANNSYSHHPYVTFFHCEKALLVSSQFTSVFPILDSSRLLAVVWFWSRGGPWGYKYSFCCALSWMFFFSIQIWYPATISTFWVFQTLQICIF